LTSIPTSAGVVAGLPSGAASVHQLRKPGGGHQSVAAQSGLSPWRGFHRACHAVLSNARYTDGGTYRLLEQDYISFHPLWMWVWIIIWTLSYSFLVYLFLICYVLHFGIIAYGTLYFIFTMYYRDIDALILCTLWLGLILFVVRVINVCSFCGAW